MYLEDDDNIFAYERILDNHRLVVICNFYGEMIENPLTDITENLKMVLSNYGKDDDRLRPYEARMYMIQQVKYLKIFVNVKQVGKYYKIHKKIFKQLKKCGKI